MHVKESGAVRDHGPAFRISSSHLYKLYLRKQTIFEIAKLSEERK